MMPKSGREIMERHAKTANTGGYEQVTWGLTRQRERCVSRGLGGDAASAKSGALLKKVVICTRSSDGRLASSQGLELARR